jgi:hypothetical protein
MADRVRLVEDDSLRVTESGYEIKLRLLWYRSLPLSCIEKIELALDGQPVEAGLLRFGINDKEFRLDELPDLVEEFWFIQDSASLSIRQPGKVRHGSSHLINLELALRFPYIPIGPGKFLTHVHRYSGSMAAV